MSEAETQMVWRWRIRDRAPWSAIARNLGRNELSVRAQYDPDYPSPTEFVRPVQFAERAVTRPQPPVRKSRIQANNPRCVLLIRTLFSADRPLTASFFPFPPKRYIEIIRQSFGSHMIVCVGRSGWMLSPEGRALAVNHYGCQA